MLKTGGAVMLCVLIAITDAPVVLYAGKGYLVSIVVKSTAFENGQPIPRKYSQDGQNISPPLEWQGLPEGTKELALIVDDPDAPTPQPWVHWVMYKIAPGVKHLPEGVKAADKPPELHGALQGVNTSKNAGYDGPAPPKGHGVHHYHFKLYALDAPLNLPPRQTKEQLLTAMKGHVLGESELIGTYER
ncbi:MAG: YbhB/YbcL family Raf kinase inhibitor-like protein [Planctomycetaceae bacterium]|nr:YbhB/YbcL family Raf kinase inhibitor-like protein [Planctomycetaceae bacterium]